MILVLALAAALWFAGELTGAPRRLRWGMIGALWLAVIGLHLLLPEDHALRQATGGDARIWAVLGGMVALVMLYQAGLRRLKARVKAVAQPEAGNRISPVEAERYARHILLREIGGAGQQRLRAAKVLVVGAGGLGAPALLYLAGAGVGTLGVIDDDLVEGSNLQRQIIHRDDGIGTPKVQSAERALRALNPFIAVRPYQRRLTEEIAADLFADYDLILDGTDNFDTRDLVNRTCVALGKPLISGAITQWEGQLSLFDPARGGPCLACLFPVRPAPGLVPNCAEAGVAAPLPGVVGSMMALEAVKHLTGAGQGLRGRLVLFDGLYGENRTIEVKRRAGCAVCGGPHLG